MFLKNNLYSGFSTLTSLNELCIPSNYLLVKFEVELWIPFVTSDLVQIK